MLTPRYGDAAVACGFVDLPHGQVHYRMRGEGPPLLALHESPRSSISLLPLLEGLAAHFTVIAIDTPGYGFSDPLPGDAPEMADYVAAVDAVRRALGIARMGLYGTHTGAAIAASYAQDHPANVAALVLDGYGVFTPAERESFITRYLAPFAPAWDGGHVMQLWSRIKDLYMWFPWYDRAPGRRLAIDPPGIDAHHLTAIGFLQAGAGYHRAYRRAAEHPAQDTLAAVEAAGVPVAVMAREDDLLHPHLDRIRARHKVSVPICQAAWLGALRTALQPASSLPPYRHGAAAAGRRRLARIGGGFLHWRETGRADAPVLLLLHDLPQCGAELLNAVEAAGLDAHFRVVMPDLPGCGQSDPLEGKPSVTRLAAVLQGLPCPAAIVGVGASAVLASALGEYLGAPAFGLHAPGWAIAGPAPRHNPLPAFTPALDGAYLTAAWFRLRDMVFYDAAGVRTDMSDIDADALHARFRAFCLGPDCRQWMELALDLARTGRFLQRSLAELDAAAILETCRRAPGLIGSHDQV